MPETNKVITDLKKELRRERRKVAGLKYTLGIPLFVLHRLLFGKRLSTRIEELRDEVTASVASHPKLDLYSMYRTIATQSPAKLYGLLEGFVLWRLRRGVLLIVVAALPTIFLVQQNMIIREQNALLVTQNEFFGAQTELLRFQTDDEAISRAIADFGTINRVDYPQIKRIADRFGSLDLARRMDQLNRLKALYEDGYRKQEVFEQGREVEREGHAMPWGVAQILEQYEYLSVFLLISTLGENNFANAHWIGIYKLDLDNSDFMGADLSEVHLYDNRGGDFSTAGAPPVLCDYPSDDNCP